MSIIIEEFVITESNVETIFLEELPPDKIIVRKFRIFTEGSQGITFEHIFDITAQFLSTWGKTEEDLFNLLLQFRDKLPKVVLMQHKDLFQYPDVSRDEKIAEIGKKVITWFKNKPEEALHPLYPDYIRNSVLIDYFEIVSILQVFINEGYLSYFETENEAVKINDGGIQGLIEFIEKTIPSQSPKAKVIYPEPATLRITAEDAKVRSEETKSGRCHKLMQNGIPCGRESYDDKGLCIFHTKEDKDVYVFSRRFEEFANSRLPEKDCYGFVFPEDFRLSKAIRQFYGDWRFQHCEFRGDARFREIKFNGSVHILQTIIGGNLDFTDTVFNEDVFIRDTRARKFIFEYTVFRSTLFLSPSTSPSFPDKQVIFVGPSQIHFKGALFRLPAEVRIVKIRLKDLYITECDVTDVRFLSVLRNNDVNKWIHEIRSAVLTAITTFGDFILDLSNIIENAKKLYPDFQSAYYVCAFYHASVAFCI